MKKVIVVGCGCIGKIVAARLSNVASVCVYDTSKQVISSVKKSGIRILKGGNPDMVARIPAFSDLNELKNDHFDLVILATKAYDTERAAKDIASFHDPGFVLSIQNGSGNFETLSRFIRPSRILCAVTTMAAQKMPDGSIDLLYEGTLSLSSFQKKIRIMPGINRLFKSAGFKTRVTKNCEGMIWSKLIFNAVMNPLPILISEAYAKLSSDSRIAFFARKAVCEAKSVARKTGIRLVFDPEAIISAIEKGTLACIRHNGSMFDDIISGAETELDFLTGAILKKAKSLGINTPVLSTIYSLAKAVELRQVKL